MSRISTSSTSSRCVRVAPRREPAYTARSHVARPRQGCGGEFGLSEKMDSAGSRNCACDKSCNKNAEGYLGLQQRLIKADIDNKKARLSASRESRDRPEFALTFVACRRCASMEMRKPFTTLRSTSRCVVRRTIAEYPGPVSACHGTRHCSFTDVFSPASVSALGSGVVWRSAAFATITAVLLLRQAR